MKNLTNCLSKLCDEITNKENPLDPHSSNVAILSFLKELVNEVQQIESKLTGIISPKIENESPKEEVNVSNEIKKIEAPLVSNQESGSEQKVIEEGKIYVNERCLYKSLGVSKEKVKASENSISYITICSSVASSGIRSQRINDSNETSNTKAALYGSADDVQIVSKLMMCFGKSYVCMGSYCFSKDSVTSAPKSEFISSLKNFFDVENTDGCMIYYSGHGFPDSSIMLETSNGSYYINYEELVSLWKKRKNPKKNKTLLLILDCCFSGSWVKKLLEYGDFTDITIQSSSTYDQKSLDMGSNKGSLYTNAFLKGNLRIIKSTNLETSFNFNTKEFTDILAKQQPRGIGYEDYIEKIYGIKGLNANSWKEIEEESSKIWNKYSWSTKDSLSTILLSKLDTQEALINNYAEPYLILVIKDGKLTIQGEVNVYQEENHKGIIAEPNDNPQENNEIVKYQVETKCKSKYLFTILYENQCIKRNHKGHGALFLIENELKCNYFNTFSSKTLTFELTNNKSTQLLNYIFNICDRLYKTKFTSSDSIQFLINSFYSEFTEMDRSTLKLDVDNEDDDDNAEEFDFMIELDKALNSNNESAIKNIKIDFEIDPSITSDLIDYCTSSSSNIESISLKVDKDLNTMKNKFSNSTSSSLTSVEIFYSQSSDSIVEEKYLELISFSRVSIDYSNISKSSYFDQLFYLSFSEKLTYIKLKGINNPIYKTIIHKLAENKNLIHFHLVDSSVFDNSKESVFKCALKDKTEDEYLPELNYKNYNVSETDYFSLFFNKFFNKENLKSFTISNCNLDYSPRINKHLESIDFSNNNISDSSFNQIILDLQEIKTPYSINLSKNYFSRTILPQLKLHLRKNALCTNFDISQNDLNDEDTLKLIRYNINQKNSIFTLNISNTYFADINPLIEIIKSNKQLSKLVAQNCNLTNSNLVKMTKLFGLESINSIVSIDFSSNLITASSDLKSLIQNVCYSPRLTSISLNNCVSLQDCKENVNLINLLSIKTLECINFGYNTICNNNFSFYVEDNTIKPPNKKVTQSLNEINLLGTKVSKLDLISAINLTSLKINSNIPILSGLNTILKLVINITEINLIPENLYRNCETLELLSEKAINSATMINNMENNIEISLNKSAEISNILKNIVKVNQKPSINDFNNTIKITNTLLCGNLDKSAYEYISKIIENNPNMCDNNSVTLDEKFKINNEISLKQFQNVVKVKPLKDYFNISNELEEFTHNKYTPEELSQNTLISKTPNDKLSSEKHLIINYNYFDFNDLLIKNEINLNYLELNSVNLKEVLKILIEKKISIKALIIRNSQINNPELKYLSKFLELNQLNLETLRLINTYIDGKESQLIFKAINNLSELRLLDLTENFLNNTFTK